MKNLLVEIKGAYDRLILRMIIKATPAVATRIKRGIT